jgi:GTP-binding protein Era
MGFKSGFVNIVGNPNVGKSTLMNYFVGERISIATFKSQTTRHRIMGILNEEDYQIVFSDTPGVLKPHYKLQESMRAFSNEALIDVDILVYVTDVVETSEKNLDFIDNVNNLAGVPKIVVINKIDLTNEKELNKLVEEWKALIPEAEIFPVSAKAKFNVDNVLRRIKELLPENPPYFEKDQLTDRPVRFFVSEIIREKILLYYDKEIPYGTEVVVNSYKEDERIVRIEATIYVEHESQKGIIIGHQGVALKKISTEARKSIEIFLAQKVFLRIFVRVNKGWRNSEKQLSSFGYNPLRD